MPDSEPNAERLDPTDGLLSPSEAEEAISIDPDARPEAAARAETFGHAVGGGMSWMVVATAFTRVTTFLAQILLGLWLVPKDFALYATATSVAGFMMVCRDMATGQLVVQRGRERYEESAGAAFWLGFTYTCLVTAVTFAAAWPLATRVYHDASLAPMLWVLAAALPIGSTGNLLFAKLRIDLRFRDLSAQTTLSNLVRQGSMIVLARLGFGPMSFAWPVLVCTLFDAVSLWWMTKDNPFRREFQLEQWPGMIRQAGWVMVNSLASFAMDFGPYLVLGPTLVWALGNQKLAYDVTGYYFFAYQITAQIGVMLAYNATVVLMPALQRMSNEPDRMRAAGMRALRTLMLTGSIASMGLAVVMSPLEHLFWNGKFERSVEAVVVFGVFYPWKISFGLCTAVLMAQGAFRLLAVRAFLECLGLVIVAAVGAAVSPTAAGIAWWTGVWLLVSRLVGTWYVFHTMGGRWTETVSAMMSSWLVSLAAFGLTLWIGGRLNVAGAIRSFPAVERIVGLVCGAESRALWVSRVADVGEVAVMGSLISAAFIVLARLLLTEDLRDMLRVSPRRIRKPLAWALGLEAPV